MRAGLRRATEDDIPAILADIRPVDEIEMRALGTTPESAMREGLGLSDFVLTGTIDGAPVCMLGVAPHNILLGHGSPWMLASSAIESAQVPFLRACRPVVAEMRRRYPLLANVVHAENRAAIRWLRWVGFRFCMEADGEAMQVREVNGHPFHVFFLGE